MAYYMIQTSFTSEAWAAMLKNPQNRAEQVRPMIEKLGGASVIMTPYWIVQAPDNVAAAALSLAAAGALRSAKTTPLMTMDDTMEALKRAGKAGYKVPG